jgi:hypothetical protein
MCARSRCLHSPATSPRSLAERAAARSSDHAASRALPADAAEDLSRGMPRVVEVGAIADPLPAVRRCHRWNLRFVCHFQRLLSRVRYPRYRDEATGTAASKRPGQAWHPLSRGGSRRAVTCTLSAVGSALGRCDTGAAAAAALLGEGALRTRRGRQVEGRASFQLVRDPSTEALLAHRLSHVVAAGWAWHPLPIQEGSK